MQQILRERKIVTKKIPAGMQTRQERMHPDDFEAHLAWIRAKQSCGIS
ncbi:MAG TPA: hypothetical protein VJ350_07380 [Methanoregula sp.]|nr:hypothetical protein [Methanoregula sp.]